MVKQIKNVRRINADKKRPIPKPEWVEAFLILLLHKSGGPLVVSWKDLKKFEELKIGDKTQMSWDDENKTVIITAPEMNLPKIKKKGLIKRIRDF